MGDPVTRVGLRDGTTIDIQASYEDVCERIMAGGLAMWQEPSRAWVNSERVVRPIAVKTAAVAWCKPLRTEAT